MSDTSDVARGAAEFDRLKPGWARLVNRATLDMGRTDRCIGAQVFGSYDACLKTLEVNHDDAYEYGIDLAGYHALCARYAQLREAWLAEVAKRV